MADYRQLFYTVNIQTGKFTDANGYELDSDFCPELYSNDTAILCLTFTDGDFELSDTYVLVIDDNYVHPVAPEESDLLAKSNNDKFNIEGDWDEVDPINRKICVRINTNTPNLKERINGKDKLTAGIEIKRYRNGNKTFLLSHDCSIKNERDDDQPEPDPLDPTYRNANSQDSIDNAIKADVQENADNINTLQSSVTSNTERISELEGTVWRKKVIDLVDCTVAPPTEAEGDRYIIDATGTPHTDWDGCTINQLVEYNSGVWVGLSPVEGWRCYVDDQEKDARYIDDGAPYWELVPTSTSSGDMLKSVYDSNDSGVVDSAEKVEGVESAGNSKYYGTNESGEDGFHTFPSSGHVIIDEDETFTHRANLKILGAEITDDSENDATVVQIPEVNLISAHGTKVCVGYYALSTTQSSALSTGSKILFDSEKFKASDALFTFDSANNKIITATGCSYDIEWQISGDMSGSINGRGGFGCYNITKDEYIHDDRRTFVNATNSTRSDTLDSAPVGAVGFTSGDNDEIQMRVHDNDVIATVDSSVSWLKITEYQPVSGQVGSDEVTVENISTTEIKTDRDFLYTDGLYYPIYISNFEWGALPGDSTPVSKNHNIANVKRVIKCTCSVDGSENWCFGYGGTVLKTYATTSQITVIATDNFASYTGTHILEYIKTSDTGTTTSRNTKLLGGAGNTLPLTILDISSDASNSTSYSSGAWRTLKYNVVNTDTESAYNSTTGEYTVPEDMSVDIYFKALTETAQSTTSFGIKVNGTFLVRSEANIISKASCHITEFAELSTGDVITWCMFVGTTTLLRQSDTPTDWNQIAIVRRK